MRRLRYRHWPACWTRHYHSALPVVVAMVSCSLIFFATTNFAVWLFSGIYSLYMQGLTKCYVLALPFLDKTVIGDLVWTGVLFGGVWLVQTALALARRRRTERRTSKPDFIAALSERICAPCPALGDFEPEPFQNLARLRDAGRSIRRVSRHRARANLPCRRAHCRPSPRPAQRHASDWHVAPSADQWKFLRAEQPVGGALHHDDVFPGAHRCRRECRTPTARTAASSPDRDRENV